MIARCPNPACGKETTLAERPADNRVLCPHCHHTFTLKNVTRLAARPAAPASSTRLPKTIARFQVRTHLGVGAFGAVYRAYDPELEREVALKVLHPGMLDNPRVRERFLREARAAAGLFHPHIVPVYDAGSQETQHYLASAFISGRSLAETLTRRKLDCDEAARVAQQLAEALAYAHKQGVVHRDVKPANVMLDERDEPHLMDFGLAHRQDETNKLTQDGALLGTPSYMAPEQARGREGEPLPASDQYSLGVVLYEMLTGRTPFTGPPQTILYNVLNQEPPLPRALNPNIPRDLETICLKAMAREPAERYADCQALADDLRRWREGEPIHGRRVGIAERLVRWVRRQPVLAAASAVAALSLLAAALVPTLALAKVQGAAHAQEQQRLQAEHEEEIARQNQRDAEEKTQLAETAVKDADRAKQEAKEARAKVRPARIQAKFQEARARKALAVLKAREKDLRRYQYVATINLAQQALADHDEQALNDLLGGHKPGETEDPRGFEWHLLRHLGQSQPAVEVKIRGTRIHFTADGEVRETTDASLHVYLDSRSSARHNDQGWISANNRLRLNPVSARTSRLLGGFADILLKGHTHSVTGALFAPDSKTVVTLHRPEPTLIVWDTATGKEKERMSLKGVECMLFSPDSKLLVAVAEKQFAVWKVGSGEEMISFTAPGSLTGSPLFAPDRHTLACLTSQGLLLWDTVTRKETHLLKGAKGTRAVFAPDSKVVAIIGDGTSDESLALWDLHLGKKGPRLADLPGDCVDTAFSPDGRLLAGGFVDGSVVVWETANGRKWAAYNPGHRAVVGVAFAPDGRRLAAAAAGGTMTIWDQKSESIRSRCLADVPAAAAFCGKGLVVVAAGKTVEGWDSQEAERQESFPEQASTITCLCVSPDGKSLVTACRDGSVQRWDVATRKQLATLPNDASAVQALAFSPDGKRIVGGRTDGQLMCWDADTGAKTARIKAHGGGIRALAFTPDGRTLVSAGTDGKVKQWSLGKSEPELVREFQAAVNTIAIHPNGKLLAGAEFTIRLWDLSSGKERKSLEGHRDSIRALTFTPDGKTLASADAQGIIKLWEPITGQELVTLTGHEGPILLLAFPADGRMLVSADQNRILRFWNGRPLDARGAQKPSPREASGGR